MANQTFLYRCFFYWTIWWLSICLIAKCHNSCHSLSSGVWNLSKTKTHSERRWQCRKWWREPCSLNDWKLSLFAQPWLHRLDGYGPATYMTILGLDHRNSWCDSWCRLGSMVKRRKMVSKFSQQKICESGHTENKSNKNTPKPSPPQKKYQVNLLKKERNKSPKTNLRYS